jgi:phosphoribosylamine-glycine ligase
MLESETDLYAAIAELDTTIRALDIMTRGGDDDAQIILPHMVNHLRPIHEKLTDEFDKLEKQRLQPPKE